VLGDLPADAVRIRTGLADIVPADLVLLPILFEDEVKAVIELASVRRFSRIHLDFLDQLTEGIGIVFNAIEANMRTEALLKQSQILFAEAQEASRSKSAFLSMAAHELRTPLSVITGYLSMLQDGTLKGPATERPIGMLMAKARELNGIVNDLLMAARIEGGTVPTQLVLLNLGDAVQEALRRAEARVHLLGATVEVQTPDAPVMVQADREQLGRILDNLINNALTYTNARPEVSIEVSDTPVPQVAVSDRGVGIPLELRDRVFERFFRIDHPELGPQPGTGLGLFISRELAQRLGGNLELAWSDVGKGSRFVMRLPIPVEVPAITPLDRLLIKSASA
jgi:signal transduction histidine kinase